MGKIASALIGLSLAVSAIAFAAPASALESKQIVSGQEATQVVISRSCRHYARYCHARHPGSHWKFRGCMALHGCR